MRWFWIDRFVEFESGRSAAAIKNVSLAEEHLHDHFPGAPLMPNALIVEGLAQTGGLLVAEHGAFAERAPDPDGTNAAPVGTAICPGRVASR